MAGLEWRIAFAAGAALLVLGLSACVNDAVPEPAPVEAVEYPVAMTDTINDAGRILYAENCAVCHADPETGGERQFDAPRHDADGHTWHHPDRALVEWVLDGVPAGGVMPPFRDQLSEAQVSAIIAYIKSTWPPDVQERQQQMSQAWEDQVGG
ncbi:MAG: cytochrome c [Dehalococcoidia bacterium]